MIKVGEHITLDFLGVKKDYSPSFYEKIIYKIAKAAKVEILNVSSHKFEPQGFTLVALLSESHFSFPSITQIDPGKAHGKFTPRDIKNWPESNNSLSLNAILPLETCAALSGVIKFIL